MSNLKFVRAMFTSKGMELRDMGQKVLWAERRSRRGWPRPARSTTGYALCSFLNSGRRPWVSRRRGSSARGRTASEKLYLPHRQPSPSRQRALAAADDRRSGCKDCGPFCIEPRREFGGRRATSARRGGNKDGKILGGTGLKASGMLGRSAVDRLVSRFWFRNSKPVTSE